MSENQQTPQANEEQFDQWLRTQFQRANKHLAENDILFDSVVVEQSRYLAPFMAIWKIKALDKKAYWVISGDVPIDFTLDGNGENARDALRYFSMQWQLKAENIRHSAGADQLQMEYAAALETSAEKLYGTYADETLWRNAG